MPKGYLRIKFIDLRISLLNYFSKLVFLDRLTRLLVLDPNIPIVVSPGIEPNIPIVVFPGIEANIAVVVFSLYQHNQYYETFLRNQ